MRTPEWPRHLVAQEPPNQITQILRLADSRASAGGPPHRTLKHFGGREGKQGARASKQQIPGGWSPRRAGGPQVAAARPRARVQVASLPRRGLWGSCPGRPGDTELESPSLGPPSPRPRHPALLLSRPLKTSGCKQTPPWRSCLLETRERPPSVLRPGSSGREHGLHPHTEGTPHQDPEEDLGQARNQLPAT